MLRRAMAVTTVLLVLAAPAAASDPYVYVDASQAAFASWSAVEDGVPVMYFAIGFNRATAEWPSMGVIGRAPCKKVNHEGHTFWRCRGQRKLVALMPGQFVVNPSLASAQLQIVTDEGTDTVSWVGRGDAPQPYLHQHAGTDVGVQVISSLYRRADVAATISGIGSESSRPGRLNQGLQVDVWLDGVPLRTSGGIFTLDDGAVEFRARLAR